MPWTCVFRSIVHSFAMHYYDSASEDSLILTSHASKCCNTTNDKANVQIH